VRRSTVINIAPHVLHVNVYPEVALIDIYDSNTGTEAATVVFNMQCTKLV
jgi:hypothetical protein